MDLLAAELGSLVLCDLSKEGLGKVSCIVIRGSPGDMDTAILLSCILDKLADQLNGLWSRGDDGPWIYL